MPNIHERSRRESMRTVRKPTRRTPTDSRLELRPIAVEIPMSYNPVLQRSLPAWLNEELTDYIEKREYGIADKKFTRQYGYIVNAYDSGLTRLRSELSATPAKEVDSKNLKAQQLNERIRKYLSLDHRQKTHQWARRFRKEYFDEIEQQREADYRLSQEFEIATRKPI